MISNIEQLKKELNELVEEGRNLYYSLAVEYEKPTPKQMKQIKERKLPNFKQNYEQWYSKAHAVIKQILPDRLDDFVKLYKNEKRKQIDFATYTLSDCMLDITTSLRGETKCDGSAAIPKLWQQIQILESAEKRFESKLFNITNLVQAELFDSELEASKELVKNGFLRGAGAIAGVVLEKHLSEVCTNHNVVPKKNYPTISDLNDLLKNENVVEIPTWRFIQHLGDLRNLCDHNKNREPKEEEVSDLIDGVMKIIKTLF